MEKKAVGRSVFISACKKSSVGVLREQSEQYPIFPSYKEDKMADNYDGMAVGVFELDNLVACFVALDAASKAANVKIQSVERNRLKSGACVKMRGSVSDVNAAMEVALETAKPLGKIVSGGELSRIMLALKAILADRDQIETLIFDEIDTGISGRTAQKVSEKMAVIGHHHQVLCITHLPRSQPWQIPILRSRSRLKAPRPPLRSIPLMKKPPSANWPVFLGVPRSLALCWKMQGR